MKDGFDYEGYIKNNFVYDDGKIIRTDRKSSDGSLDKDGYLIIKVKGKQFKAHRIVWLLNYGKFPTKELDHKNRNKLDNRIENLRESDRIQQNNNKEFIPNKQTGKIGIYIDKTKGLKKKYTTKIKKRTYRFYTIEEAMRWREENGKYS